MEYRPGGWEWVMQDADVGGKEEIDTRKKTLPWPQTVPICTTTWTITKLQNAGRV